MQTWSISFLKNILENYFWNLFLGAPISNFGDLSASGLPAVMAQWETSSCGVGELTHGLRNCRQPNYSNFQASEFRKYAGPQNSRTLRLRHVLWNYRIVRYAHRGHIGLLKLRKMSIYCTLKVGCDRRIYMYRNFTYFCTQLYLLSSLCGLFDTAAVRIVLWVTHT